MNVGDNPHFIANCFLDNARRSLSSKDFHLLSEILSEWHSASSLLNLCAKWKMLKKSHIHQVYLFLHILCFNVRGIDRRWGEICLLTKSHNFDILMLGEVGHVDFSLIGAAFSNYRLFYQAGENAHGGVIVLIRSGINCVRVPCTIPNVCIIDVSLEETTRLIAIYAPTSKSWHWSDLSKFITKRCVIMGDFNVDIEDDGETAEKLLEWADACSLGLVIPDTNTSLRSDRTIDYAAVSGVDFTIQALEEDTSSDHKPLLGVLACEGIGSCEGSRTIWPVFSMVLSYTSDFWEKEWSKGSYEITYENFISFTTLLLDRCKVYFPLKHARPSVPRELMKLLAQSRSLSFKARRKGDVMLRDEARRLRNWVRLEVKRFQQEQLSKQLKERHTSGEGSRIFWSKAKRQVKSSTSALRGFVQPDGVIIRDAEAMANAAAEYYEKLFEPPVVMRPHPYVDAPRVSWENDMDPIPAVNYPEVINVLRNRKKKQSLDIHGLSPFALDKIPCNYWHYLVQFYNYSFASGIIPKKLKEVRMILLAKKEAICSPDQTRPISLLDSFLKVQEKLFLNRFVQVLKDRGILPDNQSGFRAGYRLQTRVLLLIEQISSYMANSAPVATVFVDFKSAFDQLWFEGCLGKLRRLGIPNAYIKWIRAWLEDRRAVIEIQGKRSKWINIFRGGPQGSSISPTLFITYHSDMADYIPAAMSFFFADDLAAVLAGQMGEQFTKQCIALERRLQTFLEQLEFYSLLAMQPINYTKTQGMFSARAINYPNPMPVLQCGNHALEWISSFKYLGYNLTIKLGWGEIIQRTCLKVRQRTALVNSFRYCGSSSMELRRVLFSTFVLPYFTWIFAIYPLFTETQRKKLNHLYFTLLKRVYRCQFWEDLFFSLWYNEKSLDDRCFAYWQKYLRSLTRSKDGELLLEQSQLNSHRSRWRDGLQRINCLYRSKRYVPHTDVFGQALRWMEMHGTSDSVVDVKEEELLCFALYSETF
jgi:hypothetical protein